MGQAPKPFTLLVVDKLLVTIADAIEEYGLDRVEEELPDALQHLEAVAGNVTNPLAKAARVLLMAIDLAKTPVVDEVDIEIERVEAE